MPLLEVFTNVANARISPNFAKRSTALIAELTRKPEANVFVHIFPDQHLHVGGTDASVVRAKLRAVGNVSGDDTAPIAKRLTEFLSKELAIPAERVFLLFEDLNPSFVAKNGTLMSEIIKQSS